jgi:hypothetical protein
MGGRLGISVSRCGLVQMQSPALALKVAEILSRFVHNI